jgi:hypothetical protein
MAARTLADALLGDSYFTLRTGTRSFELPRQVAAIAEEDSLLRI